jgi:hypothetical protein
VTFYGTIEFNNAKLAMSNENQKVPQTGKEFKGSRVPVKRQMGFYWTLEPWTPGTLF